MTRRAQRAVPAATLFGFLLCACATITEFPAAGSTGEAGESSTTTTGFLPTSTTPTTAADGTSTTGSRGSDSSATDADSADPDGCDVLGCDPDVPPIPQCDIWDDDCPRGERCTFWSNNGGNLPNSTRCVPLEREPAGPGEPCTAQNLGFDDCDQGSMCFFIDETGEGECVPFCVGSPERPTCADPLRYCSIGGGPLALCIAQCDPLDPDACPRGQGCVPAFDTLLTCEYEASEDGGGTFDPCTSVIDCNPGLLCRAAAAVGVCSPDADECCTPYCDLTSPTCPEGTQCVPLFDEDHPVPSQTDIGFCGQLGE